MPDESGKIIINPNEIITKHKAWTSGEQSDASNAGKRREAIGSFAEKNGIENKALSQFRAGLKIKNDGKRKDWLRSMQLLLPVAEAEIFGNEPDMFENADDEQGQGDPAPISEPGADETAEKPDGDSEIAQEAAEFEAAADEAEGQSGTKIDFSAEK